MVEEKNDLIVRENKEMINLILTTLSEADENSDILIENLLNKMDGLK